MTAVQTSLLSMACPRAHRRGGFPVSGFSAMFDPSELDDSTRDFDSELMNARASAGLVDYGLTVRP